MSAYTDNLPKEAREAYNQIQCNAFDEFLKSLTIDQIERILDSRAITNAIINLEKYFKLPLDTNN